MKKCYAILLALCLAPALSYADAAPKAPRLTKVELAERVALLEQALLSQQGAQEARSSLLARSGPACLTDADCSGHGTCTVATGICKCDAGFITPKASGAGQCSYEQKAQLTAFLLHFFLGEFGTGEFYAGNNGWGGGQLAITLGWVASLITGWSLAACGVPVVPYILYIVGAAGFLAEFGWWLADDVLFGTNQRPDGNGEPLKPW